MSSYIKCKFSFLFLKGFNICLILLVSGTSYADKLGWTDRQDIIWTEQKLNNTSVWKDVKRRADINNLYEDYGEYDALIYLVTGDSSYAKRAFDHIKWWSSHTPTRNETRAFFYRLAILYTQINDGLNSADKSTFVSILDKFSNLTFDPSHDTRPWDSDEMTGHYFGNAIYALAIELDDPVKSKNILNKIGGLKSTGINTSTWRNTIHRYATFFKGGVWMESTGYNWGTSGYMGASIYYINDYTSIDNFPEYTNEWSNWAKSSVNSFTNDFRKTFQWGDEQDPEQVKLWTALPTSHVIAWLSNDPEAWYMADKLRQYNGSSNVSAFWAFFYDPSKQRNSPSGWSCHNADGMGVSLCRTGWNDDDYFVGIITKPWTGVDHQSNAFQGFQIFKGDDYVLNYPIGYGAYHYEQMYNNGFLVNGALPLIDQEVKGQIDFVDGGDYLYHAGKADGKNQKDKSDRIKEYVRQFLFHRGILITYDRVNTEYLPNTNQYRKEVKDMMGMSNMNHVYVLHTPVYAVKNGNTYQWQSESGDIVKVTPYWSHTSEIQDDTRRWGSFHSGILKKELRLLTNSGVGFQTLLTVINPTDITVDYVVENGKEGVLIEGRKFMFASYENAIPELFIDGSVVVPPDPVIDGPVVDNCPPCPTCPACPNIDCSDPPQETCQDINLTIGSFYRKDGRNKCYQAVRDGCVCTVEDGFHNSTIKVTF